MKLTRLATIFTLALTIEGFAMPTTLFVSPRGAVGNPGTEAQPLPSLIAVRDAIRAQRQGKDEAVTVVVAGGTYTLTEPVVFGSEDGNVRYAAAEGQAPVLSGSRGITGFTARKDGLWQAQIPEVAAGTWYFEQLYVNGRRATRARYPDNKDLVTIKSIREEVIVQGKSPKMAQEARQYIELHEADFAVLAKLTPEQARDVQLVAFHKWDNTRRFVESMDVEKRQVVIHGAGMKSWNPLKEGTRFYLENFPVALNEPGEWFLGRDGVLLYQPLPGETLATTTFCAPVTEHLIRVEGSHEARVKDLAFVGLEFAFTGYLTPPEGFGPIQAAQSIDAVILADQAEGLRLENCTLRGLSRYAVWFRNGCQTCAVVSCQILDGGAGGVRIGPAGIPEDQQDYTGTCLVDNTLMKGLGHIFPCAVGVWIGHSPDNTVSHNEICDLYYTAISVGWRWGYGESLAKRNQIVFNHLHHLYGQLSDMGGVYTLGPSEGTVIGNNVIHDVDCHSYGGWGLYTDEGTSHLVMENNLVYNTKTGAFHQHYGKENIIRNNIFAYSRLQQIQATRVEEHASFTLERNLVIFDEGVLLRGPWQKLHTVMRNNCYWQEGGADFTVDGLSFADWQNAGHDEGSIIADPKFADPKKLDFTLPKDSPVHALGFQAFDPSQAGLRR